MKALLVSNTTWNVFNFRMNLARSLRDKGYDVIAVGVADGYEDNIRDLGFGWAEWKFTRRSVNPFSELGAVNNLRQVYQRIRPDVVQHFTVKPVLYGTIAAKLAGIPAVINSVTGLPFIITSKPDTGYQGFAKSRSLSFYARCCDGKGRRSLFQNRDDLEMLAAFRPSIRDSATLLPGSGVDLDRFVFRPEPCGKQRVRVVCVARLIREKGVGELVEAAKQILSQRDDVEFVFCGSPDFGNRTAVDEETLAEWKRHPHLHFRGHVEDVQAELNDSSIVCLPSYREGTPRSLLEAAAIGRPIVSTNVPGCREVVEDGRNGFLVPARDADALGSALLRLIEDRKLRETMGLAGRHKAESDFDERIVIERTMQVYEQLTGHGLHAEAAPSGAD